MYKLIKASSPSFEREYNSLIELCNDFERNICSQCKMNQSQMREYFEQNPSGNPKWIDEEEISMAIPNDYISLTTIDKLSHLISTPCGCEFMLEGIPWK